jgi:hypothetical protein
MFKTDILEISQKGHLSFRNKFDGLKVHYDYGLDFSL